MADNLSQKSHKPSEKTKYNNIVHRTTSESLRLNESEKGLNQATNLQTTAHNPRKISSFQITSVTVGSRVSTDAAEDSADDLDESHTDDISRVTDLGNETPSLSEDTFSKDDVFYNASSASIGCAPVIPTSSQYGLAIVGQDTNNSHGIGVPNLNHNDVNDMHVSVTSSVAGNIINIIGNPKPQEGMKEIQEHVRNERFKVVKIESTEPFRRGRWTCMDYLDHTTTQQAAPIIVNNNLECGENANTLTAPDSGVVLSESQHDDGSMDNKVLTKDLQVSIQSDQGTGISFPVASPGQSLTQPINLIQSQVPQTQPVSIQSPPLEMTHAQAIQSNQTVAQQLPQSMTHISLNPPGSHPPPTQPPTVQTIPQSFPQHQLQQVIAQSQGIPQMQQIPLHQQIPPQQMQQLQTQQAQIQMQNQQHMGQPQPQLPNMQQIQHLPNQQLSQMQQQIQNQGQIQPISNQPQIQQLQLQHMQAQQVASTQPIHQIQQSQMPIAQHHLQSQNQSLAAQQQQMQHLTNQPQLHAMQGQSPHQMANHIQHMQISNQQLPQLSNAGQASQITNQNQMHSMSSQQASGQQTHAGMHPQIAQQNLSGVQQSYITQPVPQQSNSQPMIQAGITPQSQPMVQQQHSVPQYHTQQPQLSQPGQSLPQDVMANIASSQGASMQTNLQTMSSQSQGSSMPASMLNAQQGQNMTQGSIQMLSQQPQNMAMNMDSNQNNMQMPVSDQIFLQQHIAQTQNMLPQQAQGQNQQSHLPQQSQLGMQYVMPQQQNLANQATLGNQPGVVTQTNLSNMQNVANQQTQSAVQALSQQLPQVSMPNVQQGTQPVMQNIVPQAQQGIPQNVVQHSQNIPMSMQQNMPVSMQGPAVHTVAPSVVQSQTNMQSQVAMSMGAPQTGYNTQSAMGSIGQNVIPIMSQTNISTAMGMQGSVNPQIEHMAQQNIVGSSAPVPQPIMTNTNSVAVTLPVSSTGNYCANQSSIPSSATDCQNFGSPVSAVVSHVVNSLVNSSVCISSDSIMGDTAVIEGQQVDLRDGRDDPQPPVMDDNESVNAAVLSAATGAAGAAVAAAAAPAVAAASATAAASAASVPHSRAPSPQPCAGDAPSHQNAVADQTHHISASGTSAVAIDNKIEQAMDLVKSHLMFAVREEVEVLKERIAELMERITQLEVENAYLRAHASQDTLSQLSAAATAVATGGPASGERGTPAQASQPPSSQSGPA